MMSLTKSDFDMFEQEFIELCGEFQSLAISESQLRDELRKEATRAEAAEAAKDVAERSAADSRHNASAAAAGAAQATKALSSVQEELLTERERILLKEKCLEIVNKMNVMERELQQLRPLQAAQTSLQRQYKELQERVLNATTNASSEATKLENQLRRVERCANAGTEVRERARLAAAAHARERRLAANELQQATRELKAANVEIARLNMVIAQLQQQIIETKHENVKKEQELHVDNISEVRAALEAERVGSARLEKALAAAVADNAIMAAQLRSTDNKSVDALDLSPKNSTSTNICPIDSFLAD